MDYASAYYDQPGDNGYNDDPTRSGGPTGIPDPNNPGYDTGGYPLPQQGSAPGPTPEQGTGPAPVADPWKAVHPGSDGVGQPTAGVTPPPAPPPPAPAPVNLGGGALAPFTEPAPGIPNIPAYKGSQFTVPTMEEALNDPGARARWQRGQESLQNWAAARGTLNDTDTAKMLLDYGQNSEAQDYGNVYARNFGTWQGNEQAHQQEYGINRQTQYIDPWTAAYNEWVQRGNFYLNNQGTVANTALGFARL